jgi:hypothetical protein
MRFALALVALGLAVSYARADAPAKPEETRQNDGWLQVYMGASSRPPFSFTYGRQTSGELLRGWQARTESKALDAGRTEHVTFGQIRKPDCRLR